VKDPSGKKRKRSFIAFRMTNAKGIPPANNSLRNLKIILPARNALACEAGGSKSLHTDEAKDPFGGPKNDSSLRSE